MHNVEGHVLLRLHKVLHGKQSTSCWLSATLQSSVVPKTRSEAKLAAEDPPCHAQGVMELQKSGDAALASSDYLKPSLTCEVYSTGPHNGA